MIIPDEGEMVRAPPVNYIISDSGEKLQYRHDFTEVYIEDIPRDFETSVHDAEFRWADGRLFYQYGNKEVVEVREDGAYTREDVYQEGANQQAYFALSILSSHGYVGRFTKA